MLLYIAFLFVEVLGGNCYHIDVKRQATNNEEVCTLKNASKRLVTSIEELGRLYDFLNKEFFESALSKPVITIMPEERKRHDVRVLGWFTEYKVWTEKNGERAYELNVTADYADRSLLEIAETLLHEMAHQYAREHNIDDCSRAGTYHNKNYAKIASDHGLIVTKNEKYGFSITRLTLEAEQVVSRFEFGEDLIYRRQTLDQEEVLDIIEKQVPENTPDRDAVIQDLYLGVCEGKYRVTKDGVKPKKSSTRKYICPSCGMSVRATRVVNVECGDCDIVLICATDTDKDNNITL